VTKKATPAPVPAKKAASAKAAPAKTAKAAPAKTAATTAVPKATPAKAAPATTPATKAVAAKAVATKGTPSVKPAAPVKAAAPAPPPAKAVKAPATAAAPAPAPVVAPAPAPAPAVKKVAKKAPAPAPEKIPYPFSQKFLDQQRQALMELRAKELGSANRLRAEADALMEDLDPGDVQFDDESGEGDSLVVERERDLALSAQARQTVMDIDAALLRLEAGTYGLSIISQRPIPEDRLEAIPYATELVEEKVGGLGRR
jgi:RNA polymerase-binding transcription factor DksA